jgi:hypothetical protein
MTDERPEPFEKSVLLLRANDDYHRNDDLVLAVRPLLAGRCTSGRRLILDEDLRRTYLVERTEASSELEWPQVFIRPGRPIVNESYVAGLFQASQR